MTSDDFVKISRSFGFYLVKRSTSLQGAPMITAWNESEQKGFLTWVGSSVENVGTVCNKTKTLVEEANFVQKVMNEVRSN